MNIDAERCPNCGVERPANAPEGYCPRCLLSQAVNSEAPGQIDVDATTAPAATSSSHEPEPSPGDSEATAAYTPGPTAGPASSRTDVAGDWTPDADSPIETADGRASSRRLPQGITVRYFGDYEVQEELGRGGMGVVYKARQVSLNRPVALKMIKTGILADLAELLRFQNEAEAVALLDHPGIVPVYEVGEHDGQRYFSMKLIEGGNLAELLASFKDNPKAAATVLVEAAEAVHHAHMRGILHRDLKPANILIDAEGRPHVTDFGLAKRVEGDTELTASGAIMGTPAYMSPEQANGRRGSITTATDVYGLGAIFYTLLTGQAPFGGDGVIATLDAVRTRPPESPGKLGVHVPSDLETICLKCLEKDPRRRYASAHELAADLNNWLDSRPITARRVGALERAWLWCKRKPAVAALAATVVLAVAGGTFGIIAVQSTANRLMAKKNEDLRSSNTKLDQQRLRAAVRESQAIDAVKKFRDAVANEPTLKNNALLHDLRKRLLNEPLAFFKALRDQLQKDQDTSPESLTRLASAAHDLGLLSSEIGDQEDALRAFEESLAIRERLVRENSLDVEMRRDLARSFGTVGTLQAKIGRPELSLISLKKAIGICAELVRDHPSDPQFQFDLAKGRTNTGILLFQIGQPIEALISYEAALKIQDRLARENPSNASYQLDLAWTFNNIGAVQCQTGQEAKGMASIQRALAIWKEVASKNPSGVEAQDNLAAGHYNLGRVQQETRQASAALASFEKASTIQRRLVSDNPTVTEFQSALATTLNAVAVMQIRTGAPVKGLASFEEASGIQEKLAGANPTVTLFQSELAQGYNNIGVLHRDSGRPTEALASYARARVILERLAREHPDSPKFLSDLGYTVNSAAMIELAEGRFDEVRNKLRPAIELQRKALAGAPAMLEFRENLAKTLKNFILAAEGLRRADEADQARRELATLVAADPKQAPLDARLAAVAEGKEKPNDDIERLQLANRAYEKTLHATSARLYTDAFTNNPKLSDNREVQNRYNASCAAALAGSGHGIDDPPPDENAKTKLRRQALDWLKAELSVWKRVVRSPEPGSRETVAKTLAHWKEDTDLASVHDVKELAKLSELERKEWGALWAEVEALLRETQEGSL
jgi:eukaryotic-like serine/threonine-protein kinase